MLDVDSMGSDQTAVSEWDCTHEWGHIFDFETTKIILQGGFKVSGAKTACYCTEAVMICESYQAILMESKVKHWQLKMT